MLGCQKHMKLKNVLNILNFYPGDAKSKINPESKLKSLMETFFNDIQIIKKTYGKLTKKKYN